VVLALKVTHFLIALVGMLPILASTGVPPLVLWFVLGVVLKNPVFFEFLLNWQRLVRSLGLDRLTCR
jgi:hypothetical protein